MLKVAIRYGISYFDFFDMHVPEFLHMVEIGKHNELEAAKRAYNPIRTMTYVMSGAAKEYPEIEDFWSFPWDEDKVSRQTRKAQALEITEEDKRIFELMDKVYNGKHVK